MLSAVTVTIRRVEEGRRSGREVLAAAAERLAADVPAVRSARSCSDAPRPAGGAAGASLAQSPPMRTSSPVLPANGPVVGAVSVRMLQLET